MCVCIIFHLLLYLEIFIRSYLDVYIYSKLIPSIKLTAQSLLKIKKTQRNRSTLANAFLFYKKNVYYSHAKGRVHAR